MLATQGIRNGKKKRRDKTEQYMKWNNGPEKEQEQSNRILISIQLLREILGKNEIRLNY